MAILPKPQDPISDEHGWKERRNWHPQDAKLRANGFKIHARQKNHQAWWTRGGNIYLEEVALLLCKK